MNYKGKLQRDHRGRKRDGGERQPFTPRNRYWGGRRGPTGGEGGQLCPVNVNRKSHHQSQVGLTAHAGLRRNMGPDPAAAYTIWPFSSWVKLKKDPGFLGGSVGKEPACQCRRHEFNPWVRKIPWRRKWLPIQYSCLGNPMDRGAWQSTVHRVTNSRI